MKNRIKIFSAVLLITAIALTVFSGCGGKNKKPNEAESSAVDSSVSESSFVSEAEAITDTEKTENGSQAAASESSAITANAASAQQSNSTPPESVRSDGNYTYYYYNENTTEPQAEKKTESTNKTTASQPINSTKADNQPAKTTSKPAATASASAKIEEISNGVSVITKTSPVGRGDSATVIIMGKPGAEYSIEFYESDKKTASYSGLESKTADNSGVCSWTFKIGSSCEPGERKIIVKEKNSGNYAQTSITVQ
ncbi:MAG: hypothetical protein ACI4IX_04225 [Acutalibacteraceae bacterium]